MASAQVKEGNIRLTISIPQELNKRVRQNYQKQGDFSKTIIAALELYLTKQPETII
jgi:rRNA maturation endonuclease Nob1